MTHLVLTHPIVGFAGFLISEVSRCWLWFLSIVIRFVMTPTWDVVNTTIIYTNNITCDHFCWDMAHFCSMGSGSASKTESIFTTVFPEVISSSAGSANYLWPMCLTPGAGTRLWMTPSIRAFYRSSFGLFYVCFRLFLSGSKRVYSINLTSIMGRVWYI